MGSRRRRRLRHPEVPGGRIEALAVAACVRAPVCFDCDCGCGFRGGKGGRALVLRGAKRLVRDARFWYAGPVVALQRTGQWRDARQRGGGEQRDAGQSDA